VADVGRHADGVKPATMMNDSDASMFTNGNFWGGEWTKGGGVDRG
jgi:hypothetical protein